MKNRFRFVVLPGRSLPLKFEAEYYSAYETFKSVWSETFREVHGDAFELFSNDFTRQDYIQALFDGDTCVALDGLRLIHLNNLVDYEDSWFRNWKKDHLVKLAQDGYVQCAINSYFSVHKDYRKTFLGENHHISYIMGCLSVLHQLDLGLPLMFGMMRNNRSMDKLGQMLGSVTLEKDVPHNNIPSDLVAFLESNVKMAAKTFPAIVFEIFNSRIDTLKKGSHERAA